MNQQKFIYFLLIFGSIASCISPGGDVSLPKLDLSAQRSPYLAGIPNPPSENLITGRQAPRSTNGSRTARNRSMPERARPRAPQVIELEGKQARKFGGHPRQVEPLDPWAPEKRLDGLDVSLRHLKDLDQQHDDADDLWQNSITSQVIKMGKTVEVISSQNSALKKIVKFMAAKLEIAPGRIMEFFETEIGKESSRRKKLGSLDLPPKTERNDNDESDLDFLVERLSPGGASSSGMYYSPSSSPVPSSTLPKGGPSNSVPSLNLSRVSSNDSDFLPPVPTGPVTGRPSIPNSSVPQSFLPKNRNKNSGASTQRPMRLSSEPTPSGRRPPF
jgi:hypothetical protein